MGCDIHLHVEKPGPYGWERVLPPVGWNNESLDFAPLRAKFYDGAADRCWFWDRNYDLFAWLAGVRNYVGCTPLSELRDLPVDVSAEVKADSDEWGRDGHSHSWLALSEFNAFAPVNTRDGEELAGDAFARMFKLVEALRGIAGQTARIVFWFDN